jgi:hypothetical protein
MLNNYRYQKKLMVDKVVLAMKKKHGADQYKYNNEGDEFEVRETAVHARTVRPLSKLNYGNASKLSVLKLALA